MPTFPNVACVGMHFRGGGAVELARMIDETTEVLLEREPENQYDAYAIKVMIADQHIGYIERGQAAWISPLLDEGEVARVEYVEHEQRGKNSHPIFNIHVEPAA